MKQKKFFFLKILILMFIPFILFGCENETDTSENETTDSNNVDEESQETSTNHLSKQEISNSIELRKFPYPYQAMLAISTDIDATALEDFKETHRFMNTLEETKMGTGLGLDIANSFWMYVATDKEGYIDARESNTWAGQISYFRQDWHEPYQAEQIIKYIEAGWIDTMHSYGDFSMSDKTSTRFTRDHALKAIEEFENEEIDIRVWVNHGNEANIQNFGGSYEFTEYQQGDVPGKRGYHTDVTIPYGFEFLWDSMGNDEVGHESVLYPINLNDDQNIWGFNRFSHVVEDGEMQWLWGIYRLNDQLSEENLATLVDEGLYSVIAQHLGNQIGDGMFPNSAVKGLRRLKEAEDRGDILVARTSRLLEYNRNHDHIEYDLIERDSRIEIAINAVDDPVFGTFIPSLEQLRGFTFYTDDPENTTVSIDGVKIADEELTRNNDDGSGKSIGVKWFEPDYTDYTKQ